MCDDENTLCKIYDCLKSIEEAVCGDQYENAGPFTIGGATGQYIVRSPYNTECEWAVVSAMASGTLANAATFAIGSANPKQPTLSSTGGDSFGVSTSGTDAINALQSYVGSLTAQASFIPFDGDFIPLPSPAMVYMQVTTPASTEVLVTIKFRRKLQRVIPDKPREGPGTFVVPSRARLRTLPAQSKQVAGYWNQYPRPGQRYQHLVNFGEEQKRG